MYDLAVNISYQKFIMSDTSFKSISEIIFKNDSVILENVSDFDIAPTFECGQCFRFDRLDEKTYFGVAQGKEISITQDKKTVVLQGITAADFNNFWFDFFDLGRDYGKIRKELSLIHPVLEKAAAYAPGIRILKQNPWEALCSFIISQQKQIPGIKMTIARMSEAFGEKTGKAYTFPCAEKLARLELSDLDFLKLGYRDRYILSAAKMVSSGEINLENIRAMPVQDARKELMKICGVGVKVADCTLLYGLQRLDAAPVDTWMKKAEQLFDGGFPFLESPYAGIAQQYIFHYIRSGQIN